MNRTTMTVLTVLVVVLLSVGLAGCGTPQEKAFSNLKGVWYMDDKMVGLEFVTPTDFTLKSLSGAAQAASDAGRYEIVDATHLRMSISASSKWQPIVGQVFNDLLTIDGIDGERLTLKTTGGKTLTFLRVREETAWSKDKAAKDAAAKTANDAGQTEGAAYAQALQERLNWAYLLDRAALPSDMDPSGLKGLSATCRIPQDTTGFEEQLPADAGSLAFDRAIAVEVSVKTSTDPWVTLIRVYHSKTAKSAGTLTFEDGSAGPKSGGNYLSLGDGYYVGLSLNGGWGDGSFDVSLVGLNKYQGGSRSIYVGHERRAEPTRLAK